MKKMSFLLITLLLLLSGCGDTREIDQRTIVLGMGIDIEENGEYMVTVQVPILMPQGQQTGDGNNNEFETISAKGKYVWEAIANIEAATPTVLYFGHLKAITIGEKLAKFGVDHILDLLDRRAPLANEVYLIIIREKNKVEEFLEAESPLVSLPALYLDRFFNADQKVSRTKEVRLFEFRRDSNMIANTALIPFAYKDDKIHIEDMGILKDQKLVGELNGHEVGISNLLKEDKVKNMNYSFEVEEGDSTIEASVRTDLSMDFTYEKSNPIHINLTISGKGELVYLLPSKVRTTQKTIDTLTEVVERRVTEDISKTVKKMKEIKVEPWLLGHRIWAKDHEYFQSLNWNESGWVDSIFNVNVSIEIDQTGQKGMLDKKKIGR
ncbi:Ger(x)C family spore germination protein [Evansella sp. AB-rgal1]|uniref:Ger(x)C family spore germination protein n=1 Tax=Evansella sp. AB-rgal1 TaxID=3242696 RepID=UPI00359CD95A